MPYVILNFTVADREGDDYLYYPPFSALRIDEHGKVIERINRVSPSDAPLRVVDAGKEDDAKYKRDS